MLSAALERRSAVVGPCLGQHAQVALFQGKNLCGVARCQGKSLHGVAPCQGKFACRVALCQGECNISSTCHWARCIDCWYPFLLLHPATHIVAPEEENKAGK